MTKPERKAVVRGSIWMTLVSVVLSPVPLINGLVAGMIGGYRIGSMRRALLGAAIAGVVLAVVSWLLLSRTLPGILGASAGIALIVWVVVSELGLFSGAAIGAVSRPAEA